MIFLAKILGQVIVLLTLGSENSNKKFDEDGNLASSGTKNEIIFEQAQEFLFK